MPRPRNARIASESVDQPRTSACRPRLASPDSTHAVVRTASADAARIEQMLFDGVPQSSLAAYGETRTPGLADLFVATMKGTYA